MAGSDDIADLLVRNADRLRIGKHVYSLTETSRIAIDLAFRIFFANRAGRSLWGFRNEITESFWGNGEMGLVYLIGVATNPLLRRVAIWLYSQIGGHAGEDIIARFAKAEDERTRIAVAKALRRNWKTLEMMATCDTSP